VVFVSCVNVLYSNTSKFSESKKTGTERSVAMEVEFLLPVLLNKEREQTTNKIVNNYVSVVNIGVGGSV